MVSVLCGTCRAALDDPSAGNREPCPVCGSMQRIWPAAATLRGEGKAFASAAVISANLHSISAVSDLLLQSVIVASDKTVEGTLIEAVATPSAACCSR
jgi:hypothetical protein